MCSNRLGWDLDLRCVTHTWWLCKSNLCSLVLISSVADSRTSIVRWCRNSRTRSRAWRWSWSFSWSRKRWSFPWSQQCKPRPFAWSWRYDLFCDLFRDYGTSNCLLKVMDTLTTAAATEWPPTDLPPGWSSLLDRTGILRTSRVHTISLQFTARRTVTATTAWHITDHWSLIIVSII